MASFLHKEDTQEPTKKQETPTLRPIHEWIEKVDFTTTADIEVPKKLIDQVIGQDQTVDIIKKAA